MRYIFLIAGFFFVLGCYPSNRVSPNANHKEIVRILINELDCFWDGRKDGAFQSISVQSLKVELTEKCINDGLEYQLKLLALLKAEAIEEVYLCSPDEIWLEVEEYDSFYTMRRMILGHVDEEKRDSLCLFTSRYDVQRIERVDNKWYIADIWYFLF